MDERETFSWSCLFLCRPRRTWLPGKRGGGKRTKPFKYYSVRYIIYRVVTKIHYDVTTDRSFLSASLFTSRGLSVIISVRRSMFVCAFGKILMEHKKKKRKKYNCRSALFPSTRFVYVQARRRTVNIDYLRIIIDGRTRPKRGGRFWTLANHGVNGRVCFGVLRPDFFYTEYAVVRDKSRQKRSDSWTRNAFPAEKVV